MKQKLFSFTDDYKITDADGKDVYYVDGKLLSLGKNLSFQDMEQRELALIQQKLDVVELCGGRDWRFGRMAGLGLYLTPLGPEADAALDRAWLQLTDGVRGEAESITLLGRRISIPRAAHGAAQFSFDELCARPLAAADYLAIARRYHVLMIERIPLMRAEMRDESRRITVLIDTLYDQNVKLVCSAAATPDALCMEGESAEAFCRTASRLTEMQSLGYLERTHGLRAARPARTPERVPA